MAPSGKIQLLGMAAGVLTTASALPEVYHIYKTGQTGGTPLLMALATVLGEALWVAYAYLLGLPSLGLFSSITLVLWIYITIYVIKETAPGAQ
jgi:MtN3 and saliva related transmembrane protein